MIEYIFNFLNINPWNALHWLLVVSVTFFLLDLFLLNVDFLAGLALMILAAYFTLYIELNLGIPQRWSVAIFIVILISELWIQYKFISGSMIQFIEKIIFNDSPTKYPIDQKAPLTIRKKDYFIHFEGSICGVTPEEDYTDPKEGDIVRITKKCSVSSYVVTLEKRNTDPPNDQPEKH